MKNVGRRVFSYRYHRSAPPRPQTPWSRDPEVGKTFQWTTSSTSPKDSAAEIAQNTVHNIKQLDILISIQFRYTNITFLADSRFSEWLGNSSSVRWDCLSDPGTMSALVSASTVESLCTDDSSGEHQGNNSNSVNSWLLSHTVYYQLDRCIFFNCAKDKKI